MCNHLPTCGFSLKAPIPNSTDLPPAWDEDLSDEPAGWYYTMVKVHHPDGTSTIEYANKAMERIDLHCDSIK